MADVQGRYKYRALYLHFYMFFVYVLLLLMAFNRINRLFMILVAFLLVLAFLSTFWSTKIHLMQCFSSCSAGDFVFFQDQICPVSDEEDDKKEHIESFFFNRRKYLLKDGVAHELTPVIEQSFANLRKGITVKNYSLYPPNEFKVPHPSFLTMFKEQCVTPLFCFQVFSSLLLCFDEHVMNSLVSTGMIVFVEASFVLSRVNTMKIFRKLEHKECELRRERRGDGSWTRGETVMSTQLRPGDVAVISTAVDIPCDLAILEGTCAVNEALLSGESVPLLKEEIIGDSDTVLSLKCHKKHLLFAGTRLEKVYSPLKCIVLRTGFNTEQGILLNKMLQSEDIKYDPGALRFILLLSLISLLNSVLTIKYSKKSGYELFVDIIILFTSSIPFELPMEMGMSIQSAVKNLMAKKIYCLEPFRIALAGKVDVCCFDKTGTLTETRLEVKRIEGMDENTEKVLSCCHNLIFINEEVKGDPLDLAIYNYDFLKHQYKTYQQFSFSSELKRHCVVAEVGGQNKVMFCMKGAPDEVKKYLRNCPRDYNRYREYAASGYRVIALACRELSVSDLKLSKDRLTDRGYLEKDLSFCGFVLLGSSLRDYAREMCRILRNSGLKTVIITGDSLLTAMSVAEQLEITGKGAEGMEIEQVLESKDFASYSVFGRAEPLQKEMIVRKYQSLGFHTMMVGDGTNDVGALKAADVGVAMLEAPIEVQKSRNKRKRDLEELESIKPGDASIAAPLTVRSNSLKSIVEIIQQGRSSLVTTIQMYKILALNSITSAFFQMFLDIIGIKFSDPQMVSIGVLSSIGFTAITQPKALDVISKERPITSIFSPYVFVSLFTQAVAQVLPLYAVYKMMPIPEPAKSFEPSIVNTVLFIISCVQTVSTLVCNYIGRPFREDLVDNKMLGLSLLAIVGFIGNIFLNLHPELNNLIKVVDVGSYAVFVVSTCVLMVVLCFVAERVSFRLFMIKK